MKPHTPPPVAATEGPWNPGVLSEIPVNLLPLATIYRAENVCTTVAEARELAGITGLPMEDLVVFRPERLAMHEVLVRVTADYTVEDGERTEDLGINFRRMSDAILSRHVMARMPAIAAECDELRARLQTVIARELALLAPAKPEPPGPDRGLLSWFRRAPAPRLPEPVDDADPRAFDAMRRWEASAAAAPDTPEGAACHALARVAGAMLARHGRLWGDASILASVAAGLAFNEAGGDAVGRMIDPHVRAGARAEGFRELPVQAHPVVMNTKGASAAGKSTLRPLQRALAARIGVSWSDFALVSPDIFRKFLLDYGSLGADYKYAGSFTGHELHVVDRKLDRYMARKAARGDMPHLLIDRFRFDTFAPASDVAGSNLLTRFGHLVYLFFMITPPHETVERAWKRGLEVGRYKAVDDLLAHNIEAYSGMPEVFFTWALSTGKQVHYEFLDNDVPLGTRPRTVAFGWNGEMNVLDVKCLLDVDRYRRIDVGARAPEAVYADAGAMAPERNTGFLAQCVQRLPAVNFAERGTGCVYLRTEGGAPVSVDPERLAAALADPDTRAGIAAVAPRALSNAGLPAHRDRSLRDIVGAQRLQTLGDWAYV